MTDQDQDAIERAWIELLATVWRDVDWSQFDRQRTSRTEIFGEKLLSAETQPTPSQALDELCRRFGLAGAHFRMDAFDRLRADPDAAIQVLRDHRVYLAAATRRTIDRYYDAYDEGDEPPELAEVIDA